MYCIFLCIIFLRFSLERFHLPGEVLQTLRAVFWYRIIKQTIRSSVPLLSRYTAKNISIFGIGKFK